MREFAMFRRTGVTMKSFLKNIRMWWKLRRSVKGARSTYIVDGSDLNQELRSRRRMAPREQLALLDRVSRFARRENIKLVVVFESRPLRKVPQGAEYRDVAVYYAGMRDNLADTILNLMHKLRGRTEVTVVTSNNQLEDRIRQSGGRIMRCSTFRKALESTSGREQRRERRPPRRRSAEQPAPSRRESRGPGDTVESMIDVVR
ncbi:MAG: hypothetical protein DRP22_02295 [Verrucomicrobia bacterium]|nr:MAG: hypothetical protein DRP22_02295 [Verrucomicrobiota bacterium]